MNENNEKENFAAFIIQKWVKERCMIDQLNRKLNNINMENEINEEEKENENEEKEEEKENKNEEKEEEIPETNNQIKPETSSTYQENICLRCFKSFNPIQNINHTNPSTMIPTFCFNCSSTEKKISTSCLSKLRLLQLRHEATETEYKKLIEKEKYLIETKNLLIQAEENKKNLLIKSKNDKKKALNTIIHLLNNKKTKIIHTENKKCQVINNLNRKNNKDNDRNMNISPNTEIRNNMSSMENKIIKRKSLNKIINKNQIEDLKKDRNNNQDESSIISNTTFIEKNIRVLPSLKSNNINNQTVHQTLENKKKVPLCYDEDLTPLINGKKPLKMKINIQKKNKIKNKNSQSIKPTHKIKYEPLVTRNENSYIKNNKKTNQEIESNVIIEKSNNIDTNNFNFNIKRPVPLLIPEIKTKEWYDRIHQELNLSKDIPLVEHKIAANKQNDILHIELISEIDKQIQSNIKQDTYFPKQDDNYILTNEYTSDKVKKLMEKYQILLSESNIKPS